MLYEVLDAATTSLERGHAQEPCLCVCGMPEPRPKPKRDKGNDRKGRCGDYGLFPAHARKPRLTRMGWVHPRGQTLKTRKNTRAPRFFPGAPAHLGSIFRRSSAATQHFSAEQRRDATFFAAR